MNTCCISSHLKKKEIFVNFLVFWTYYFLQIVDADSINTDTNRAVSLHLNNITTTDTHSTGYIDGEENFQTFLDDLKAISSPFVINTNHTRKSNNKKQKTENVKQEDTKKEEQNEVFDGSTTTSTTTKKLHFQGSGMYNVT